MEKAVSSRWYGPASLSAAELYLVHGFAHTARPKFARASAIALSRLGDGWVYPAIGIVSLLVGGFEAIAVIAAGMLNALVLHSLYPVIKRLVARPRPYERDATLVPLLRALDRHSFPSGHAMTLPAALVPLGLQFPLTIGLAFATALLMAWARLACAHQYPSDVAVGTALGVGESYPISMYALAASRLVS